mmetsp:Transcript_14654/g.25778  ORF Transcript_14654/g.25778 Transcript_14654/m.25778 type:complete len:107 (+) Transcript_14654:680-1000(+)
MYILEPKTVILQTSSFPLSLSPFFSFLLSASSPSPTNSGSTKSSPTASPMVESSDAKSADEPTSKYARCVSSSQSNLDRTNMKKRQSIDDDEANPIQNPVIPKCNL